MQEEKRGTINMLELVEILQVAYHAGASDVHLTVGIPPTMRLNGHLVKMIIRY